MYIEQGNLFNSINFNLPPETPGMAGDVPFMPPYQNPNRENATASPDPGRDVPLPVRRHPPLADWPGGNSYLGNLQTWACDLSESNPSTVAPSETAPGHLLLPELASGWPSITDGLSNTAFFSEKIRGTGTRDADARSDSLITGVSRRAWTTTYLTCQATEPADRPRA